MGRLRFNSQAGELNAGSTHDGSVILPALAIALTDAVFNGTTTVTSAAANFDATVHTGAPLDGNALVPAGAYIQSVTDAHTIVMTAAATGSGGAEALTVHAEEVMNSPQLGTFPTVTTPGDYAVVTLDPAGVNGKPEVVYVTYHPTGDTWAQIQRNPPGEGATVRAHVQGEAWKHGPVASDFGGGGGGVALPGGLVTSSVMPTLKTVTGTLPSGGGVLYTCPAGKRAIISTGIAQLLSALIDQSGGSAGVQGPAFLSNPTGAAVPMTGLYLGTNAGAFDPLDKLAPLSGTWPANDSLSGFNQAYGTVVLMPGESFAMQVGGAGLYYVMSVLEQDEAHASYRGIHTRGASSFTYTAPAGGAIWPGYVGYCQPAAAATAGTLFGFLVPSGGAKGADNYFGITSVSATGGQQGLSYGPGPVFLNPGDELIFDANDNTTGVWPEGTTPITGVNVFTDVYEMVS